MPQIGVITDELFIKQWNLKFLHIPEAWAYTQGEGVVVGVIDTGVDGSHKDLGWSGNINITANDTESVVRQKYAPVLRAITEDRHPKILPGWNFVNNSNHTWDANRHGTYMAGTIAAESDGFGMVGVAPMAKIRPYVVLNKAGSGTQQNTAKAILKAAEDGCDVINLSLAWWSSPRSEMKEAVAHVATTKTIMVAAAGNHNRKRLECPASLDGVIAIGGCAPTGERWVHDKYKGSNYGEGLICTAPASAQTTTRRMRSRHAQVDATSQATANMSGVVALLKSLNKCLKLEDVTKLIKKHSSSRTWDEEIGYGVPDVLSMVKAVAEEVPNLQETAERLRSIAEELSQIASEFGGA